MRAAFLSVVVACGAVFGCADDPAPRGGIETFCDSVCRAASDCDSRVSWRGCYDGCVVLPVNRSLAGLRSDAAAVIAACLPTLDCQSIFDDEFDACWDRAREQTAPSAHLLEFCPPYSTYAFECGYWFSVEDCEQRLNIWDDAFLDGLAACTREATCEASDACFETKFGGG